MVRRYGQEIKHNHAWVDITPTSAGVKVKIEGCKVCGRRREDGTVYKWENERWSRVE